MYRLKPYHKQHFLAFGLIETIISAAIISIGALGLTTVQYSSLKNSMNSSYKKTAAEIATEIITRMQLNPNQLALGNNNNGYADLSNGFNDLNQQAAPASLRCYSNSCGTTPCCTISQVMETDLIEMRLHVQESLPTGRMLICFDSTNPGTTICDDNRTNARNAVSGYNEFTVKVKWDNPATSAENVYETKFISACSNVGGC